MVSCDYGFYLINSYKIITPIHGELMDTYFVGYGYLRPIMVVQKYVKRGWFINNNFQWLWMANKYRFESCRK